MSYSRPVSSTNISDSWQGHKNRRPPSVEPGTDYAVPTGMPVFAVADGVIRGVKHTTSGASGRAVHLEHSDGNNSRYLHLSRIITVPGQAVKAGQVIAYSGSSANGRDSGVGAHLHATLWMGRIWGSEPVDLERYLASGTPAGSGAWSQDTVNRQVVVNAAVNAGLVADGIEGAKTREGYKSYQRLLAKDWGYKGDIDGRWGPQMQAAHQRRWDAMHKAAPSAFPILNMSNIASIGDVRGLQKIARQYGYRGAIDNDWGPGSKAGFGAFLTRNWGGSAEAWLRARWGYVGDNRLGPVMRAALQRANAANFQAL